MHLPLTVWQYVATRRLAIRCHPPSAIAMVSHMGLHSTPQNWRVDDLAYGLGLWYGVVRERNIGPLKPQIRV